MFKTGEIKESSYLDWILEDSIINKIGNTVKSTIGFDKNNNKSYSYIIPAGKSVLYNHDDQLTNDITNDIDNTIIDIINDSSISIGESNISKIKSKIESFLSLFGYKPDHPLNKYIKSVRSHNNIKSNMIHIVPYAITYSSNKHKQFNISSKDIIVPTTNLDYCGYSYLTPQSNGLFVLNISEPNMWLEPERNEIITNISWYLKSNKSISIYKNSI